MSREDEEEEGVLEERLLEEVQEEDNNNIDDLTPSFHAESRNLGVKASIFSLLASMFGGGVLTLPYATSRIGVFGCLILCFICGFINENTYFMLIMSSRITKSISYDAVGESLYGKPGRIISMIVLVLLTILASVSYLILLGTLVGELIVYKDDKKPSREVKNLVSIGFAIVLLPLSTFRSLHTLRYTNSLSVFSVILLLIAVMVESIKEGKGFHNDNDEMEYSVKYFPNKFGDLLYAIPFFITSFSCHFSVVTMHTELKNPTIARVRAITRTTAFTGWILYCSVGILGYLYDLDETCDTIFSNLPHNALTVSGRVGLIITLTLSFPLFILPCRATIFQLILTFVNEEEQKQKYLLWFQNVWVIRAMTFLIVSICTAICCLVPSIAFVMSFSGSTLGFCLGMILPSYFYIGLPANKKNRWLKIISVFYFFLGIFLIAACLWSVLQHSEEECKAE